MRKNMNWMMLSGLLLIGMPVAHASDRFSLSTGANYSSGKYGTATTTDIWSAPFTAAYRTDRWTFKLTVPYIRIHGSGNVIPGTGPVNNSNPFGRGLGHLLGGGANQGGSTSTTTAATTASGLGDIVASAGYTLVSSADRSFGLDLTGKVKFGTADVNKGLGTGQNDYGLSLDTYKVLGQWTPFGGVGWMNYGSSQYIKLKNGFNANAGVDYRVASSDNVGMYYYYRQRIAVGGAAQSELTAYWNHKFSDHFRLQSYALGGMTNGSPDWGAGASVKYSF
ncbi:MAG: transporter [Rhodanobacter sp.]|nr:MAG: transporter [Rhodanobacter sp.]